MKLDREIENEFEQDKSNFQKLVIEILLDIRHELCRSTLNAMEDWENEKILRKLRKPESARD